MNIEDFRAQLEQMAGPEPSPTTAAREAVQRRVRTARRRTGAITATAAVLVIAIAVAGVHAAQDSPVRVRTLNSTTPTTPPECTTSPPTVPPADVPTDVAKWASNAPVVGVGALWAVRSILFGPEMYDSGVYRMKVSWLTRPFGIPSFSAHRLDGPGTFQGNGDQAIDQRGEWVASTLEFSAAGCWAVTVSYQGATISYQILVGKLPKRALRPKAGTITGTLRVVGGTVPGARQAVAGTIHVDGLSESWAGTTASDGTFTATALLPGSYAVTGTPDNEGGITCSVGDPVVVRAGETIDVNVTCNLP
jgi:hypothetical protein